MFIYPHCTYMWVCVCTHTDTHAHVYMSMHAQSCPTVCDSMDYSPSGSSAHGKFSRQEYGSGLPFPTPGDLPDPGIEPMSPELAGRSFTTALFGKPIYLSIYLSVHLSIYLNPPIETNIYSQFVTLGILIVLYFGIGMFSLNIKHKTHALNIKHKTHSTFRYAKSPTIKLKTMT